MVFLDGFSDGILADGFSDGYTFIHEVSGWLSDAWFCVTKLADGFRMHGFVSLS